MRQTGPPASAEPRSDPSRPDQARPDQARPDWVRPDRDLTSGRRSRALAHRNLLSGAAGHRQQARQRPTQHRRLSSAWAARAWLTGVFAGDTGPVGRHRARRPGPAYCDPGWSKVLPPASSVRECHARTGRDTCYTPSLGHRTPSPYPRSRIAHLSRWSTHARHCHNHPRWTRRAQVDWKYPIRSRGPARCSSTSPRAPSTGLTCYNVKDFTRRPPGAPPYPGLECSGRVAAAGPGVTGWRAGDEVCALLAGGGYAQRVTVPAGQVLPVPEGLEVTDAAALPEAACTVWANVFQVGRLAPGETVLVHGGASGVGTTRAATRPGTRRAACFAPLARRRSWPDARNSAHTGRSPTGTRTSPRW